MEALGVEEVVEWVTHSAILPQYTEQFRDNNVNGDMLLDLIANGVLRHVPRGPRSTGGDDDDATSRFT